MTTPLKPAENDAERARNLSWFALALQGKRGLVDKLMGRLKDVALRAGTSLSLHRKFMRMMEQVAFEKSKELEILNEIEAVERLHAERRRQNQLQTAGQTIDMRLRRQLEDNPDNAPVLTKKSPSWLFWFVIWYLFFRNRYPVSPQPESPTQAKPMAQTAPQPTMARPKPPAPL